MLHSYINKEFLEDYIPTVMDVHKMEITTKSQQLDIVIHDTAGQEDFKDICKITLLDADTILVCHSINSYNSLKQAQDCWIPAVKGLTHSPPFMLVGTKRDLENGESTQNVDEELATKMAKEHGAQAYARCSSKTYGLSNGKNGSVEKVFKKAFQIGSAFKLNGQEGLKNKKCLLF